jgi:predicted LPLAT superfamily acyltransferase
MPSWEGKSKATPLGYRIFVGVLKTFGIRPAYGLLRLVALYYVFFSASSTKNLYSFFRHRLGRGKWSSIAAIYQNYYWFGQTLIDKVVVQSGMPVPFEFEFEGEQHLRKMVTDGKGGLLLSAHIGNWEIAGHLLKRLNTTINIVMYDGEQQQIKAYLQQVTGARNTQLILIKEDLSHIFAISEALGKNELVCIHADRFMEGNKTLRTSFLQSAANFPAGPFILASRFNVPVSFVFACKENSRQYHFFASEPARVDELPKTEKMQYYLQAFAKEMELKTKRYPEQWFNYYDFWQSS